MQNVISSVQRNKPARKSKEKKKMVKNKTSFAIASIVVFTVALATVALPITNAQSSKATYAFIGAMPNPVGVNQEVLLHIGIPDPTAWPQSGWRGLTVTVTKPDGTTQTLGPVDTDTTGGTGILFRPTETGTYFLQTNFPEQKIEVTAQGVQAGTTMKASTSAKLALNVTETPVEYYPAEPLPTEYWTRPINAQQREWSAISANWLVATPILPTDNLYAPNNEGPESAHILWTRPIGDTMGGHADGLDGTGYGIGDAYEGKWVGSCIIGGVLFYNKFDAGQPQQQVIAVDLHTGKELYTKTFFGNQRISFGQVLHWKSMNYQGDFSYLWVVSGTNWYAFEPLTGEWKYNITGVPSGTNWYGPNGEILRYTLNTTAGWMNQWNSTTVVTKGKTAMGVAWGSQTRNTQQNASNGYDWNVTIPAGLPGSVRTVKPTDKLIGAAISTKEVTIWALSLKAGQQGQLLFKTTWNAPADWAEGNQTISWAAANIDEKVAVLYSKERNRYFGFSLETGNFLWGPTPSENYLNIYDRISTINYGRLISSGCSGTIICYNATTGDILWTYDAVDPYTEFQFGNNWWLQQLFVTDRKVYLGHVEHSPNQPLPRGAPFICLDVETGAEVWKMTGGFRQTCWGGKAMIGDSVIALQDTYDQRIYAIGKGPSATTVTAPDMGVPFGSSVTIKGSVLDVSPGTQSDALTLRFPNGVPAVSDASMSEWMKYVYMQFPRPTSASGVEVTISVLDENGNFREIGKATGSSDGFYSLVWTPDIPGKYSVYASFEGSAAYYPSHAETAFAVDEAPPPVDTNADTSNTFTLPPLELYFAGATVAIILAIAVVAMLILKKRP